MSATNYPVNQGRPIASNQIQDVEDEIVVAPATLDTLNGDRNAEALVEAQLYESVPEKGTVVQGMPNRDTAMQSNGTFQHGVSHSDGDNLPTAHARRVRSKQSRHDRSLTGDQLLLRMKQKRKAATVSSGLWGGVIGLLLLGPVGAVGLGFGSAVITKHSLKRREKKVRTRLQERLNPPRITGGVIC